LLILGGKQYEQGIFSVPLIVLAYFFGFLYGFYVNYEFAKEKTIIIPIATILAATMNIILNIYVIPRYGIIGASFTTVISYFLMLLFHYLVVVIGMKHRDFPDYYMWISILIIFISVLMTYLVIHHFILRCILGIVILLAYLLYIYYFVRSKV
ncbi:MAG: polysaccharide biosynthesis C-terminal domain-containing protein, partial [Turicibacter sp.]|nr:polysaccharide biosynthesis C-terminal domain-containing protein [Turicibacter sp.]